MPNDGFSSGYKSLVTDEKLIIRLHTSRAYKREPSTS